MKKTFIIICALMCAMVTTVAQTQKVTGIVVDQATNEPIIGATVMEKGTQNGTVTDFEGKFELVVPQDANLEFSYMGFHNRLLSVKGKTDFKVSLEEDSKQLEEVVVVGYGTMKKRDVTGSISSLGEAELDNNRPINLASALQGKVSGLEIVSASEPGSVSNYRIRGASTLNAEGSTPLFIVDGMEVDNIDNISPADMASVEVLKDAASAAIYGSKSANGVIIITTKRGTSTKPTINVNYSLRISDIARTLPQMNRRESQDFEALRTYYAQGNPAVFSRDSLNPSYKYDYYYQEDLFRTGLTHQVDASIGGMTDKVNYFASINYLNDDGIQLNTWNKRGTGRINVDYKPHEKVTLGSRLSLSIGNNRKTPSGARERILERPATLAMKYDDGSYAPVVSSRNNPLAFSEICTNNNKYYEVNFNQFINWEIVKGLNFKASIAGTFYQNNHRYYEPAILNKNMITASSNTNTTSLRWTHEDVLSYNATFAKDHNFTAMAGFSLQGYQSEYIKLSVSDNISEAIETSYAFNEVDLKNTYHYQTENRLASFFARVGYDYKGRYLINANVRADGSSRFGAKKKWGVFPSVSAGWRISDERWMEWAKPAMTDWKFRYSFGMTGNQTASDFAALSQYSTITYATTLGIYPSQLENDQLGWETTYQHNLGMDLSFFNNRLALNLDLYKKDTKDVLFNMSLPGTSGFSSSYVNIGSISNKGIEFTIAGHIIKTKDFDWTASVNMAFNRNKIYDIPEEHKTIQNNIYIIDNGYTLGTMYGYKALGIYQYDQSNAYYVDEQGKWNQLTPIFNEKDQFVEYQLNGKKYDGKVSKKKESTSTGTAYQGGDVIWDDLNGDGVINADDRQVIGCGQPDFTGGFNTEFRWKGLSIGAFFQFSVGGDVINVYEANRNSHAYSTITQPNPIYLAQAWQAPGDVAKYPIPTNKRSAMKNGRLESSLWVQDGSYIRLKNLKVAYSLPQKWVSKMHMQDWTFQVMMQDFFTWTKYDGFDPEIPSTGFAIGYDNMSYPRAKSVLVATNITF